MKQYPIETSGILCESELLSLGWPEEHEFELITELRNKSYVRKWFLNDRVIELDANRRWLAYGMDRPKEALLSVRLRRGGSFLGTVGWSDWDLEQAEAWFGRIAVDPGRLREAADHFPRHYEGVALDATVTLRDFAFSRMGLKHLFTYFIAGNVYAARLNRRVGMQEVRRATRTRGDGTAVETVELRMSRERWEGLRGKGPSRPLEGV
jgi:RimJ/RimL family protein N-acetyltransferase